MARAIQQTTDGGFIVAGSSNSIDGDVTGNPGGFSFWVVKLNPEGDIEWQRSLGGPGNDFASSIQQTKDGGFIVAGYSANQNYDDSGWVHSDWVVKLDSNGEIEWERTYGGIKSTGISDIRQTKDGGFIFAGTIYFVDEDVIKKRGESSCWVVKLNSIGEIEWERVLGGSGRDSGRAVRQTKDGNFIVAANTTSSDGDVTLNRGKNDFWVIKLDTKGGTIWQRTFGGSDDDRAADIQQTTDGGYIVVGSTSSNDGDVYGRSGFLSYWIIRLDVDGHLIWQRALGQGVSVASSVQQMKNGGYIIAGRCSTGGASGPRGAGNYWIVRLNTEGDVVWQKFLGGNRFERATSIQQTSDGGFIVAGYSSSSGGDVTGNPLGGTSFWIVKLGPER